jgi:hypothetical protein
MKQGAAILLVLLAAMVAVPCAFADDEQVGVEEMTDNTTEGGGSSSPEETDLPELPPEETDPVEDPSPSVVYIKETETIIREVPVIDVEYQISILVLLGVIAGAVIISGFVKGFSSYE